MCWYAAHLVLCVRFKSGAQDRYPVWENIVLVSAKSQEEAFDKADEIGRQSAGDDSTFKWGRRAARWEFMGVRKLVECALQGDSLDSGDEITYSELELDSLAAVRAFAEGGPVRAKFDEQFRDATEVSAVSERKRKRA
jgi:hypothetical protein